MIKKLIKVIREYKKQTILTPLFVSLEKIMEVIIPFVIAILIDKGIDASNMNVVYITGAILIFCSIFSLTFGYLSGKNAAIASSGFAKNLRHDMYYKVQEYSFNNIDKFSSASIVTRLTTDVSNVQQAFQMITRIAVRAPLMMIFSLIMAFNINSKVSLVFLGIIPILGLGLFLIVLKVKPMFERLFKTYDRLNNKVQENVRGIRVVKSFVQEEYEITKFKETSNKIKRYTVNAEKILAFNNPLMQFCMYTAIILISWFSARLIVSGSMTTGELTSLISYASGILSSLMMLSMIYVMCTMAIPSAERCIEILDEESNLKNPIKPINKVKNGSIEFKNVDFSYVNDVNKLSLKNINIKINSGETIGVLGGTGSSKSTLVSLIPRLYDTTIGNVIVGGVDVRDYDIESLRDQVSMVLQKNVLFSGTILENLRWGNEKATLEEVKEACSLAQADFVETFPDKYDTYIEQGGTNVSGGQKQRLCIARALLKKPKILILDDSTSAVDTKTDMKIREALKKENPEMTKIIIAQRINSVESADRIIILNEGIIEGIGTHDELIKTNDIYKEVYESQTKGGIDDK